MTRSFITGPGLVGTLAHVLLFALTACGDPKVEAEESPRGNQEENLHYKLADNTVWLRPGAPLTVLEQTEDRLVLSELPRGLTVGKVLVSSMGTGALRKVLAVSQEQSSVVVETGPATLTEAFAELELEDLGPLGQAELGQVTSDVPGVSFEWVQDPSAQARGSADGPSLTFNTLKMSFGRAELSSGGVTVEGDVFLRLNPVLKLRMKPGLDGPPEVSSFEAGAKPEFQGTLTVSSPSEARLSLAKRVWIDRSLGLVRWGPLVFVAKLRVESELSGLVKGSFSSTYSLNTSAVGLVGWNELEGGYTRASIAPSQSGRIDENKARLDVRVDIFKVDFRFDLYGMAGPYVGASAYENLSGAVEVDRYWREGMRVKLRGGFTLKTGVSTDFRRMLGARFDVDKTAVRIDAPMATVYEHFFPFKECCGITVEDMEINKLSILEVALDGAVLGRTPQGGREQFRVTGLSPGIHRLSITRVDNGGPDHRGLMHIVMDGGLHFSTDGTGPVINYGSELIRRNQTLTYDITVPDESAK